MGVKEQVAAKSTCEIILLLCGEREPISMRWHSFPFRWWEEHEIGCLLFNISNSVRALGSTQHGHIRCSRLHFSKHRTEIVAICINIQYNVDKYHIACEMTVLLRLCLRACLNVYKLQSCMCEWMLKSGCKFPFCRFRQPAVVATIHSESGCNFYFWLCITVEMLHWTVGITSLNKDITASMCAVFQRVKMYSTRPLYIFSHPSSMISHCFLLDKLKHGSLLSADVTCLYSALFFIVMSIPVSLLLQMFWQPHSGLFFLQAISSLINIHTSLQRLIPVEMGMLSILPLG